MTEQTGAFRLISKILMTCLGALLLPIYFNRLLLFGDYQVYFFGSVMIGLSIFSFFIKRWRIVGSIKFTETDFELSNPPLVVTIDQFQAIEVYLISYRGGRVGLTFLPSDGSDNELIFWNGGEKIKVTFKLESRGQGLALFEMLSHWKTLSDQIKIKSLHD